MTEEAEQQIEMQAMADDDEDVGESTVYVFENGQGVSENPIKVSKRTRRAIVAVGLMIVLIVTILVSTEVVKLYRDFETSPTGTDDDDEPAVCDPEHTNVSRDDWEDVAASVKSAMAKTAVDPCVDFYQYSCGGWLSSFTRPADKTIYVKSFSQIYDQIEEILKQVMVANWPMVTAFYRSCLDMETINSKGTAPLMPLLQVVESTTRDRLMHVVSHMHEYDIGAFFDFGITTDIGDPNNNIPVIDQGGMGLRVEDYTDDSERSSAIRMAYTHLIQQSLRAASDDKTQDFGAIAEAVFQIEKKLAEHALTRTERRNTEALYHVLSRDEFMALSPSLDWAEFFEHIGLPDDADRLWVTEPDYFRHIEQVLHMSISDLQNYMRWRVVHTMNIFLPQEFQDFSFNYSVVTSGAHQRKSREDVCTDLVNEELDMLVGRFYLFESGFTEQDKAAAEDLVHQIKTAFASNLDNIDWMDKKTRGKAKEKLDAMRFKIGFPSKWEDYSDWTIKPGEFFANGEAGRRFEVKRMMSKAGQPVDKDAWFFPPQTVNAGYSPSSNEMQFPAAILQPPFYSASYPIAKNYGSMASVTAHELTHGFDDQGSRFDKHGALKNWWSNSTAEQFNERAQCLVDVFDKFHVGDQTVNGALTLGENIADIGGIKTSFRAFQTYHKHHKNEDKQVRATFNMTSEELFFVSWAQVWCRSVSEETAALLLELDVHSPSEARVNAALSQVPAFADTFKCDAGTPLNPLEPCELW